MKRRRQQGETFQDLDGVTASEVAAYGYCAKAWHLEYVLGHQPSDAARERRGAVASEHFAHARELAVARTVTSSRFLTVALVLLALAIALIALAFFGGR